MAQLFRNVGGTRFEDVTARAGRVFELSEVSRGAALGDVDNDGDIDVLVGNDAGPVRLLVNEVGHRRPWLGLRLVDDGVARDVVGARVEVALSDGTVRWRRARADGSYGSANDPRVLVGLGAATAVTRIRVGWPDGTEDVWTAGSDLPLNRYTTLVKGRARP